MQENNIKKVTVSKGYRLKASTHDMIRKVQLELNLSQDKVISRAVKLFYASRKKKLNKKL